MTYVSELRDKTGFVQYIHIMLDNILVTNMLVCVHAHSITRHIFLVSTLFRISKQHNKIIN